MIPIRTTLDCREYPGVGVLQGDLTGYHVAAQVRDVLDRTPGRTQVPPSLWNVRGAGEAITQSHLLTWWGSVEVWSREHRLVDRDEFLVLRGNPYTMYVGRSGGEWGMFLPGAPGSSLEPVNQSEVGWGPRGLHIWAVASPSHQLYVPDRVWDRMAKWLEGLEGEGPWVLPFPGMISTVDSEAFGCNGPPGRSCFGTVYLPSQVLRACVSEAETIAMVRGYGDFTPDPLCGGGVPWDCHPLATATVLDRVFGVLAEHQMAQKAGPGVGEPPMNVTWNQQLRGRLYTRLRETPYWCVYSQSWYEGATGQYVGAASLCQPKTGTRMRWSLELARGARMEVDCLQRTGHYYLATQPIGAREIARLLLAEWYDPIPTTQESPSLLGECGLLYDEEWNIFWARRGGWGKVRRALSEYLAIQYPQTPDKWNRARQHLQDVLLGAALASEVEILSGTWGEGRAARTVTRWLLGLGFPGTASPGTVDELCRALRVLGLWSQWEATKTVAEALEKWPHTPEGWAEWLESLVGRPDPQQWIDTGRSQGPSVLTEKPSQSVWQVDGMPGRGVLEGEGPLDEEAQIPWRWVEVPDACIGAVLTNGGPIPIGGYLEVLVPDGWTGPLPSVQRCGRSVEESNEEADEEEGEEGPTDAELETAYEEGYEAGSAGDGPDNPYDDTVAPDLWAEWDQGWTRGRQDWDTDSDNLDEARQEGWNAYQNGQALGESPYQELPFSGNHHEEWIVGWEAARSEALVAAETDGAAARRAGEGQLRNPYGPGTMESAAWLGGWTEENFRLMKKKEEVTT